MWHLIQVVFLGTVSLVTWESLLLLMVMWGWGLRLLLPLMIIGSSAVAHRHWTGQHLICVTTLLGRTHAGPSKSITASSYICCSFTKLLLEGGATPFITGNLEELRASTIAQNLSNAVVHGNWDYLIHYAPSTLVRVISLFLKELHSAHCSAFLRTVMPFALAAFKHASPGIRMNAGQPHITKPCSPSMHERVVHGKLPGLNFDKSLPAFSVKLVRMHMIEITSTLRLTDERHDGSLDVTQHTLVWCGRFSLVTCDVCWVWLWEQGHPWYSECISGRMQLYALGRGWLILLYRATSIIEGLTYYLQWDLIAEVFLVSNITWETQWAY